MRQRRLFILILTIATAAAGWSALRREDPTEARLAEIFARETAPAASEEPVGILPDSLPEPPAFEPEPQAPAPPSAPVADHDARLRELERREAELARREAESAPVAMPAAAVEPAPAPRVVGPVRVEPRESYREFEVTLPAGQELVLELGSDISSEESAVEDPVVGRVVEPILVEGRPAVPVGSLVHGRVTEARRLKKIGGRARLAIEFDRLETETGVSQMLARYVEEGPDESARDAKTIAVATAAGAILGRAVKHRKKTEGTLIGSVVGAAVGAGVAAERDGRPVELSAGETLRVSLDVDVQLTLRVRQLAF